MYLSFFLKENPTAFSPLGGLTCPHKKKKKIKSDNTKTISYVNNIKGIVSEKCNDLSKQICDVCISEKIWISAVHIPGKQNTIANFMSRSLNENTEW